MYVCAEVLCLYCLTFVPVSKPAHIVLINHMYMVKFDEEKPNCYVDAIFLNCLPNLHRRRQEEYDLHNRKRPRIDYPAEFSQRAGQYCKLGCWRLFLFTVLFCDSDCLAAGCDDIRARIVTDRAI